MPLPAAHVEYQEAKSPLGELLRGEYAPLHRDRSEVVRTPDHLLPSRWQVIDYVVAKYGHCPPADIEIVYGSAFVHSIIPTGKLYIDCIFQDCDLEPSGGYLEVIDSLIRGGRMPRDLAVIDGSAWRGVLKGNVVIESGGQV